MTRRHYWWVTFDSDMPEHPKVWQLSDAAYRLHSSAICYCHRHMTDGLIAKARVSSLVPKFRTAALAELVERGLWKELADGEAYEVHDYLDWNQSRDQLEAQREVRRAAGRRGAKARWAPDP